MNRQARRALGVVTPHDVGYGFLVAIESCADCGGPICPTCGVEAVYCEGCGLDHCETCRVYVLQAFSLS
jgi:hypothetical protein